MLWVNKSSQSKTLKSNDRGTRILEVFLYYHEDRLLVGDPLPSHEKQAVMKYRNRLQKAKSNKKFEISTIFQNLQIVSKKMLCSKLWDAF